MLKGKSAVITGSTSGIGLGIAGALAGQGCNIMLNGLGDAGEIEQTRAGLAAEHEVEIRYNGADMTRPDEIENLIDAAAAAFGGVDILVNNAGVQHVAPIDEFPPEKWDTIIAVNLSAAFHATRHALPHMKAAGWGRIINTGSTHALIGSPNKAAYTAAKHGILGLTKVVALETAGTGITCNAFCPGFTFTDLIKPQIEARAEQLGVSFDDGGRDLVLEKQPSGQFVTIEQLAALILFLCSDAAVQITGAAIPVDGGWTAQ